MPHMFCFSQQQICNKHILINVQCCERAQRLVPPIVAEQQHWRASMSHFETHGYTLNTKAAALLLLVGQHYNKSICILT